MRYSKIIAVSFLLCGSHTIAAPAGHSIAAVMANVWPPVLSNHAEALQTENEKRSDERQSSNDITLRGGFGSDNNDDGGDGDAVVVGDDGLAQVEIPASSEDYDGNATASPCLRVPKCSITTT